MKSRWFTVRSFIRCALGDHGISAGGQAYYNPASRLSICADCMKAQYGMEPPSRPFVFRGDSAIDHRAKRAGND